jgi:tRNA(Arg) A34 adenosine deaminase TadA
MPTDLTLLRAAIEEARAAEIAGEVPIGAVIVRNGEIIGRGQNRVLRDHDPTAHAEIVALREAGRALENYRLIGRPADRAANDNGCTLYVTLEPCAMCAGAISFARVRRLYYAAPDPKGGAVDNGPRFFRSSSCHHAPEVYGGLRESEAASMLRAFFAARR